jgi:NADH-quinone oxidoreductase subunit A
VCFDIVLCAFFSIFGGFTAHLMPGHPYAFLALFFGVALAFPLVMLGVAQAWVRFFQPAKPGPRKNATYECGLPSGGDSWIQFKAHYYLYALFFLIFDVEVLFLLPFAVAFTGLSTGAWLAMLVFVLLLAEGLVWAWHRGYLEWK